MQRKILFNGTLILENEKITNKAVLLENDTVILIDNLNNLIKIEPKSTITDLINLENKIINLKQIHF